MPLIVLHTSRACLWDTFISLPLAFAVFSGSSVSVIMEYPHFGMFYFSDCAFKSVKAIYMAFRRKTRSTIRWTSLVPFFGRIRAVRCYCFTNCVWVFKVLPKTGEFAELLALLLGKTIAH